MEGPWAQQNLDAGASMIVPVPRPLGGALVLGESVIAYFNGSQAFVAAPIKQTIMRAAGMIDEDGSRFLLGDYAGVCVWVCVCACCVVLRCAVRC